MLDLLSDGVGYSLCIGPESRAFVPAHPLEHLEAQVLVGQLVLDVVRLIELFATFEGLELK